MNRVFIILLLIIIPVCHLLSGPETNQENSRLILLAEDSFITGLEREETRRGSGRDDFLKSAAIYQTLIEERGILNGKIFFNQGNSWFSAGETGRAVLAYRRALRFMPLDRQLRNNLHQAEESIINRIASGSGEEIKHIIFFFHYDIPGKIKSSALLILSLAFWALMITGLFRPGIRRFILIPLIPGLILGASLLTEVISEKVHPELVLVAEETIGRKGDAASYAAAFDAPLGGGTAGKRIEDAGEWWLVRLESGDECWIPESAGELVGL